jgi:hypothetical protein
MAADRRLRRAVRAVVCWRPFALVGFAVATVCAFAWGCLWLGHYQRRAGVHFFQNLPRWAFGRGGTTIGAVYLTRTNTSDRVLEHERVHVEQWRRYGLAFVPLYLAAGREATRNRFEIEAGLELGGYRPRRATGS